MIRTILVPAVGDPRDLAVFASALGIARKFSAHMDVLHVCLDAVDIAVKMTSDGSGGGVLIEGLINQLERDARERETKAKRLFDEFCARESLSLVDAPSAQPRAQPSVGWHVETGDEALWMSTYGMAADLIVAGRGEEDEITARAVVEAVLLETGRPLLIPNAVAAVPPIGGTVVIAWKPTPQAARAVAAAMPFITLAKNVVVMTVEEGSTPSDTDRLVHNLAWHGCSATAEILHADGQHPVEALIEAVKEKAGLLVMGGYGHSRLREWVFGGFTQRVLADAPVSVLMTH